MALFITFEGIDASGKATQAKLLADYLDSISPLPTLRLSFPDYKGVVGGYIGEFLRGEWSLSTGARTFMRQVAVRLLGNDPMAAEVLAKEKQANAMRSAYVLQCMMAVDKIEKNKVIRAELDQGRNVVSDRYDISGEVYGAADGLPEKWLWTLSREMVQPNLRFLLDIPVEESVARRPERRDSYERDLEKLSKIRKGYLAYFTDTTSTTHPFGNVYVDGAQSQEAIHEIIKTRCLNEIEKQARKAPTP